MTSITNRQSAEVGRRADSPGAPRDAAGRPARAVRPVTIAAGFRSKLEEAVASGEPWPTCGECAHLGDGLCSADAWADWPERSAGETACSEFARSS